jgi:hypothetical protein
LVRCGGDAEAGGNLGTASSFSPLSPVFAGAILRAAVPISAAAIDNDHGQGGATIFFGTFV